MLLNADSLQEIAKVELNIKAIFVCSQGLPTGGGRLRLDRLAGWFRLTMTIATIALTYEHEGLRI